MDVKTFVSETIKQIIDGVNEVGEYASEKGAFVSPYYQTHTNSTATTRFVSGTDRMYNVELVEFDLSVTVEKKKSVNGKTGASIAVFQFTADGLSDSKNSSVSRIHFSVPVALPQRNPK